MIEIAGRTYDLSDPVTLLIIGAAAVLILMVALLIVTLRRAGRSGAAAEIAAAEMMRLGQDMHGLGANQQQLVGALQNVSDAQIKAQQQMEQRLADMRQQMADRLADNATKSQRSLTEMQERMREALHGTSKQTATSLTQLQERLATIDKAQSNIEKLSDDVLGLQDILSNKQARGAFGEIQLNDIVGKALPADSYTLQATLSNGKRADCLIHLPKPPGPIVIDAKFPLEPYEALVGSATKEDAARALSALKTAVRVHIKAISERYLIEGETADSALMFVPSEAVYAELHARLPDVVREGFAARVWIVSPTTCMATLNTMRAVLKDARMREQAGAIRKELGLLYGDVERLETRVGNLDRHFNQAAKDIEDIKISAEKAGKRSRRLDAFDFEELSTDDTVVPLPKREPPKS